MPLMHFLIWFFGLVNMCTWWFSKSICEKFSSFLNWFCSSEMRLKLAWTLTWTRKNVIHNLLFHVTDIGWDDETIFSFLYDVGGAGWEIAICDIFRIWTTCYQLLHVDHNIQEVHGQKIPGDLISCYKSGDVREINNEKVIIKLSVINSDFMGVGRRQVCL